jgi:hypothetical protein
MRTHIALIRVALRAPIGYGAAAEAASLTLAVIRR